jgi:hypothetical protein
MVQPTNDVVAIVVDMRNASSNSLNIHDNNDEYVDKVGLDFKGSLVIVPWMTGLKFICYGSCKVGLVYENNQEIDSQVVDQQAT